MRRPPRQFMTAAVQRGARAATAGPCGEAAGIAALYTLLANEPSRDFGWRHGAGNARAMGYRREWMDALPAQVFESAAAGGCPFTLDGGALGPAVDDAPPPPATPLAELTAAVPPGTTVVDLGCGAGADVCLAALACGPTGRVYAVDTTPAMLEKARANVAACGFTDRVVFVSKSPDDPQLVAAADARGDGATAIPAGVADLVISNNVINLLDDMGACYERAHALLRPGGRLHVVDVCYDGGGAEGGDERQDGGTRAD